MFIREGGGWGESGGVRAVRTELTVPREDPRTEPEAAGKATEQLGLAQGNQ